MEEKVRNFEVAQDRLTHDVIECALFVHRELGPGLLESAYEQCLSIMLSEKSIPHQFQVLMPIEFGGRKIENAYRLDLMIDNRLVVELKTVEKLLPIHEAQILTYLRLSKIRIGLLMNFNSKLLKDGIRRFAL